jgi:regulator of sirC expression with transglutaminase-like and TPR domain
MEVISSGSKIRRAARQKARIVTYVAKDAYEVCVRGTTIARMYTRHDGTPELRILQGMPRDETVGKLLEDCPDFCKQNGITRATYPKLF